MRGKYRCNSRAIRSRSDPGRAVQAHVAIRRGKRGESVFDGIENDGQVLDAHLAHEAGNRPDLHRALGGGARRRAKSDRRVEALQADIAKAGAVILGVSTDPLESHAKFTSKYKLNFPLLSDQTADVSKMYGAWREKNLNGRRTWGVARMTYWIGSDGRIKKVYKNVDAAKHGNEILADIQAARSRR